MDSICFLPAAPSSKVLSFRHHHQNPTIVNCRPRKHHVLPFCRATSSSSSATNDNSTQQPIPRRDFLQQAIVLTTALTCLPSQANSQTSSASKSTNVYFDISVAGRPKGRIVINLDQSIAPHCTETFEQLVSGTLRNKTGSRTASYSRSVGTRVIKGNRVYLGRLNQIDSLNQSPGTPQRQQATVPYPFNEDVNDLKHDERGLVSLERGGSFEFTILAQPAPELDAGDGRIIIGKVIEGIDVVDELVKIPTNQKTIRDGYRSLGKAIGDPRAKVQLEDKPLQKILITGCGVL